MRVILILFLFILPPPVQAKTWLCETYDICRSGSRPNSSAPAQPTTNSTININPAAVPTAKTTGVEALYYKGLFDFALVKGLGRVGAAISPSNTEETFFGPPGFEIPEEYGQRKSEGNKLPSQKVALASAFNIYSNKKNGLKKFELNLGVMGKYNKISYKVSPGGGLSGIAGPFTFGYSAYSDSFIWNKEAFDADPNLEILYNVETYSAGIFLDSVAIDYSELRIYPKDARDSKVSMLTGSLLLKDGIITLSWRKEISDRYAFNFTTHMLEERREKEDVFGGVQWAATKNIMVGAFYNYYLLHEISLGVTAFF